MFVCFTFSIMSSNVWYCKNPAMTQSSPKLTAFQSDACIGEVMMVFLPMLQPIRRKTVFESKVPADRARGTLHQAKKQSWAKK